MKVLLDLSFIRSDCYTGVAKYAYRILDYIVLSNQCDKFKLLLNVMSAEQMKIWYPQFDTIVIGRRKLLKIPIIRTVWCMFEFSRTVRHSGCTTVFCPQAEIINCLKVSIKKIIVIHDLQLQIDLKGISKFLNKIRDNISVENSDAIITISEFSKKQILSYYPEVEGRIFQLGNSVSINEEDIEYLPISYKYILYVGRLSEKKNVLTLLKAYYRIRENVGNRKLVIVGRANSYWEQVLVPYIESKNLQSEVVLIESCSEGELIAWYKGADLFVFPSMREGWGSPPLEAAISGVPVITSLADSLAEVTMGILGSYENPLDDEALSHKMLSVLSNPPTQKELEEIKKKLLAQYSPKIVGKRICDFICSFC